MDQSKPPEASQPMSLDDFGKQIWSHNKKLIGFFRNKKFSQQESEDLAQDTMFKGVQGYETYQERGQLKAWLLALARSVMSDTEKYHTADKRTGTEVEIEECKQTLQANTNPQSETIFREGLALGYERLDALDPELRRIVVLKCQGSTFKEIADLLMISTNTASGRHKKALKLLQKGGK